MCVACATPRRFGEQICTIQKTIRCFGCSIVKHIYKLLCAASQLNTAHPAENVSVANVCDLIFISGKRRERLFGKQLRKCLLIYSPSIRMTVCVMDISLFAFASTMYTFTSCFYLVCAHRILRGRVMPCRLISNHVK